LIVKPIFDKVISFGALLVLLPTLLIAAIFIKINSKRPVF